MCTEVDEDYMNINMEDKILVISYNWTSLW